MPADTPGGAADQPPATSPAPLPADPGEFQFVTYRTWLWVQLRQNTRFAPLARFILSGGPDGMWLRKHNLRAKYLLRDLEELLIQKQPGVTPQLVKLCKASAPVYVAERAELERQLDKAMADGDDATPLGVSTMQELDGNGRDGAWEHAEGEYIRDVFGQDSYNPSLMGMALVPPRRCSYTFKNDAGNDMHCRLAALSGSGRCSIHGGVTPSAEDMRAVLRRSHAQIIVSTALATTTLVDLMQNSPQDLVRLKAAEAVLDRAGLVPGVRVEVVHEGDGPDPLEDWAGKSPAEELLSRLERLRPVQVIRGEVETAVQPPPAPDDTELLEEDPDGRPF